MPLGDVFNVPYTESTQLADSCSSSSASVLQQINAILENRSSIASAHSDINLPVSPRDMNQALNQHHQQQQQQVHHQHHLEMAMSPITAGLDLSFLARLNPELYQCLGQSLAYIDQGSMTKSRSYGASLPADAFVPGAISNRTLEHLTESTMRPYRAIRGGEQRHNSFGIKSSEPALPPLNDRGILSSGGANGDCFNSTAAGGSFLSDSDSSGISNGLSSELSDAALVELMNSFHSGGQSVTYPAYSGYSSSPVLHQQPHTPSTGNQLPSGGAQTTGSPTPFDLLRALSLQADIPMHRAAMPSYQGGMGGGGGGGMGSSPTLYNDFSLSADLFASRPWTALNTLCATSTSDPYSIERAAKLYRNAATISEPTCTWSGQLPVKIHRNPAYSCKVFLGGVPWDITEAGLQSSFRQFGPLKIEWPGKDGKHPRYPSRGKELPVGYVYIHFESERSVKSLLLSCTHDFSNGGEYYYKISSRRMRSKEVQVIPWVLSDSNYVKQPSQRLDPQKTVFVGALHGMLTAEGLAHIMNDLFDNVVYAGIDTDKHKYPIGSGRVTFSSHKSYVKAVSAAFIEIKTSKFTKKIQIDPYLEESPCGVCSREQGSYFCRNFACFRYYCRSCWQLNHRSDTTACYHKPLMRNNKTGSIVHGSQPTSVCGSSLMMHSP